MFVKKLSFIAVAAAFACVSVHGQDAGALLDLLVKKRLITDQEAEEVR
nr:porin [Chthoniobacterales bacterium]